MTIAIIGATGQLGGHTVDALLERGVPAGDILALGRDTGRLAALAERGLRAATVDLDDVGATAATLAGVEKLLLISVGLPGQALTPRGNGGAAPPRELLLPRRPATAGPPRESPARRGPAAALRNRQ